MHIKLGEIIRVYNEKNQHYFMCGDIMKGDLKIFLDNIPIDIEMIYTDPPWNNSSCEFWRNLANESDKSIKTYSLTYDSFLKKVNNQFLNRKNLKNIKIIWIETGISSENIVKNNLNFHNLKYQSWTIIHNHPKRPFSFIRFGKEISKKNPPNIMRRKSPIQWAFEQKDSLNCNTVLDFCIGTGITARECIDRNKNICGFELNPERINYTINLFIKKGYKVEKIL